MNNEVNALSRKNIRDITNKIRKIFGLKEQIELNIVKLLERILFLLNYTFEIVEDNEMKNNYAEFDIENKHLKIRCSTYDGACKDNPRDRFTIAHEIGHIILHSNVTRTYARTSKKPPSYKDPEWQANVFAAELLIPIDYIKFLSISDDDISKIYKVSKKVAQIQSNYRHK